MMFRIILAILIINLCITKFAVSQITDISRNGIGHRLRSQTIEIGDGRLSSKSLLNLRTNQLIGSDSRVSIDGKILVLRQSGSTSLLKKEGSTFREIDIPFSNDSSFRNTYLSSDGKRLVIKQSRTNNIENSTLHFFNTETESIDYQYSDPLLSFAGILFNYDALIFTFLSSDGLRVIKRNEDSFETVLVNRGFVRQDIKYFSPSGDRIFFYGLMSALDEFNWFVIKKDETNWLEPQEFIALDADGSNRVFAIVDFANNGRTLLVNHLDLGLAITHETDGKWSVPEPIGYIPRSGDKSQMSENGKVIAVQKGKRFTDTDIFYDLFIYLQNSSGEWVSTQVNDSTLDVYDGILLSDDGTQLFWLPANTSSVPGAEEYR